MTGSGTSRRAAPPLTRRRLLVGAAAGAAGLTDLSGVWTRYEAKGWVRDASRDAFSYHGKTYGIPLYESYYVLFYSKPVFKKLGLSVPQDWAGLLHCAEVLKRHKVTPF